jgi:hypothetical protein
MRDAAPCARLLCRTTERNREIERKRERGSENDDEDYRRKREGGGH